MDIPQEIWTVLKLLKRGYNGSRIISEAVAAAHARHPQTWKRRFAKRYIEAIGRLLSGEDLLRFSKLMGVKLPSVSGVALGRRGLRLL